MYDNLKVLLGRFANCIRCLVPASTCLLEEDLKPRFETSLTGNWPTCKACRVDTGRSLQVLKLLVARTACSSDGVPTAR